MAFLTGARDASPSTLWEAKTGTFRYRMTASGGTKGPSPNMSGSVPASSQRLPRNWTQEWKFWNAIRARRHRLSTPPRDALSQIHMSARRDSRPHAFRRRRPIGAMASALNWKSAPARDSLCRVSEEPGWHPCSDPPPSRRSRYQTQWLRLQGRQCSEKNERQSNSLRNSARPPRRLLGAWLRG